MSTSKSVPPLEIRLLGEMQVLVQGQPIRRLRSRKGLHLLAIVALRGGKEVPRSIVIASLWPDADESNARASLRQSLTDLRGALGDEAYRLVSVEGGNLRLDVTNCFVDTLEFVRLAQSTETTDLTAAADLYRGSIFPGATDEWLLYDRETVDQQALQLFESLGKRVQDSGDFKGAMEVWRRALFIEPYRESIHRNIMICLAECNDYAALTAHYRALRARLSDELRSSPSAETTQLYEGLRDGAKGRSPSNRPIVASRTGRSGRIPRPLTRMIGRDEMLNRLNMSIRMHAVVTLVGPGGVGKTRLSIESANTIQSTFRDGALFVDLAGCIDEAGLLQEVRAAAGLADEPFQSLESTAESLRSRNMLLVLDNCEQITHEAGALVKELAAVAPAVRMVCTARNPLGITGETIIQVVPLTLPDRASLLTEDILPAAVELFLERVRSSVPGWKWQPERSEDVAGICRQLDGLPLALELAAPLLRILSPAELKTRLDDRLRLLKSSDPTLPQRQQSLHDLIDWSYRPLSKLERRALRIWSVCEGGWDLPLAESLWEAAGEETETCLGLLSALVEKSLVRTDWTGEQPRYSILESIRMFALSQLREEGEERVAYEALAQCCLNRLIKYADSQRHFEQSTQRDRVDADMSNCTAALNGCETLGLNAELHCGLISALWRHWIIRGSFVEGWRRTSAGLTRLSDISNIDTHYTLYDAAGAFAWYLGRYDEALRHVERCLEIARQRGDRSQEAHALSGLGTVSLALGNDSTALDYYQASLSLRTPELDGVAHSNSHINIGHALHRLARRDEARDHYNQALMISREIGDPIGVASSHIGLGNIVRDEDNLSAAETEYRVALDIMLEAGDVEGICGVRSNLARVALMSGDDEAAERHLREALVAAIEIGTVRIVIDCMELVAGLMLHSGDNRRAHVILCAAEQRLKSHSALRAGHDAPFVNNLKARIIATLSESARLGAEMEGRNANLYRLGETWLDEVKRRR